MIASDNGKSKYGARKKELTCTGRVGLRRHFPLPTSGGVYPTTPLQARHSRLKLSTTSPLMRKTGQKLSVQMFRSRSYYMINRTGQSIVIQNREVQTAHLYRKM